MPEITTHRESDGQVFSSADEEALLQSVLSGSDRLLADSLREEERRRRRRRLVRITLLLGGIAMGTTLVAVLAGWLTLFTPPPAETAGSGAATQQTALDEDARIERAEEIAARGWELWQQRKMAEAAKQFEEAVELDPESANAWNGLGWARFNGGEGQSAVEAFEKCVELEPNHPAGLNGLGQAYLSFADYATAEKYLKKAAPTAPAAQYGLARLYLLTGDYGNAQTWIRKALRSQPGDESLKSMLAAARKKEIPADLRRQLEPLGKPDTGPAAKAAAEGWRQFNAGNSRSAERSFRRALAKDPENPSAMNGLAFLLLNKGKASEAKPYFEKCLKADPDAAGPMNGLARCLKEEGKVDEAIALWEKMHDKYPGPNAAAVGLAVAYQERGEHAKALPYLEALGKAQPENAEFKQRLETARKEATK